MALRYLYANLAELQPDARLREFTISQDPAQIAAAILTDRPQVVGFGVYIWNTIPTLAVMQRLKALQPDVKIILGGPEVSYETDRQPICALADHVIQGEADLAFRDLCRALQRGEIQPHIVQAVTPEIKDLASPYAFYNAEDCARRTIYVEASRGCPYHCEFCLSSLDDRVRNFPLPQFFADLDGLIARGVRQFKFIDRTFNLGLKTSTAILQFFLARMERGLFLHFELVPDRLPEELRALIRQFPAGALQFEIGIQTWNETVAGLIQRRQDYEKTAANLMYLRTQTGVHLHTDLIAGLPGEDETSFAAGFDRLLALRPHEIQVGILKRLRGTPIVRHDQSWQMIYDAAPPYRVLSTRTMEADTLQRIARFAKFWDRLANSGEFPKTLELYFALHAGRSAYAAFSELAEFLFARFERTHSIELLDLVESLRDYLCQRQPSARADIIAALAEDYSAGGRRSLPRYLQSAHRQPQKRTEKCPDNLPRRQQRHWIA